MKYISLLILLFVVQINGYAAKDWDKTLKPDAPALTEPEAVDLKFEWWDTAHRHLKSVAETSYYIHGDKLYARKVYQVFAGPNGEAVKKPLKTVHQFMRKNREWIGSGTPPYRRGSASKLGVGWAKSAARNGNYDLGEGYAEARSFSGLEYRIMADSRSHSPQRISYGFGNKVAAKSIHQEDKVWSERYHEYEKNSFSVGQPIAWDRVNDGPFHFEAQDFLIPKAEIAGSYEYWVTYWNLWGPLGTVEASGCEYDGQYKYPSMAESGVVLEMDAK